MPKSDLKEAEDYYLNSQGLVVFTSNYLLKRGHCCLSGCFHCPYSFDLNADPNIPRELLLAKEDQETTD